MRKFIILMMLSCISVVSMATEKFTVYCKVSLTQVITSTYAIIIIDSEPLIIPDKDGNSKVFKTKMSVVNALSKLGWKLEPSTAPNDKEFIMSKQVTNDAEALQGLKKHRKEMK